MSKFYRELSKALKENKSTWDLYKDLHLLKRLEKVFYLSDLADPILNPYYSVRRFFRRIKRIIEWLPVLWRTEDWDSSFTLDIWAYSLKRLKRGVLDEGHHVVTKTKVRNMQTAIGLLERLRDKHTYADKHLEAFNKKWGEPNYYFKEVKGTKGKPGGPYYSMENSVTEGLTPKQLKRYNKEFSEVFKLEDYHYNQDIDLLFKILKKHMRAWWD
jgi:hypothetical protein